MEVSDLVRLLLAILDHTGGEVLLDRQELVDMDPQRIVVVKPAGDYQVRVSTGRRDEDEELERARVEADEDAP